MSGELHRVTRNRKFFCVRLSMAIPYPMWDDFPCPWRYSLQIVDVLMEKTVVNAGIVHCHV